MEQCVKSNIINLCVVDDHPIIFFGIELILRNIKGHSIHLTKQYTSGSEVIRNLTHLSKDVILIDICLPDMKGYDLARTILESYPNAKIGIYSSMLDREYVLNSFKSGVLGYLPKTARPDEIIDFILTLSRGERHVRGIVADIIFEKENLFQKTQLNITKRELEILHFILEGHKNKEIAEILNIAERTVEFHKQNIHVKLGVNNSIDLYKTAKKLNLVRFNEANY
jgi:DNA-binding NarL/FixJ family response regulator